MSVPNQNVRSKKGFKAKDFYTETPKSGMSAEKLLSAARLVLMSKFSFWGKIAHNMTLIPSNKVNTTQVDARGRMYYNPLWVNSFTMTDAVCEFAHECHHIVQRCFERRGNRMHGPWNRAADMVGDCNLVDAGLEPSYVSKIMVGPEEAAIVEKYGTIEGVYKHVVQEMEDNTDCKACKQAIQKIRELEKNTSAQQKADNKKLKGEDKEEGEGAQGEQQPGDGGEPTDGNGEGEGHGAGEGDGHGHGHEEHTCGNFRECCVGSSADASEMDPIEEQKWKEIIIAAKIHAEGKGQMPAGWGRKIDEMTKPKVRWTEHLRVSATKKFAQDIYTYKRQNRRGMALGIRLPGHTSEGKTAVLNVDTSGSVSNEAKVQAAAEAAAIIRACGCEKLWLILSDAEVYFSGWITEAALKTMVIREGGTSHIGVFKAMARKHSNKEFNFPQGEEIGLMVCFTDLGTDFPKDKPGFDVLWAVFDPSCPGPAGKVPFGRKIVVPVGEKK